MIDALFWVSKALGIIVGAFTFLWLMISYGKETIDRIRHNANEKEAKKSVFDSMSIFLMSPFIGGIVGALSYALILLAFMYGPPCLIIYSFFRKIALGNWGVTYSIKTISAFFRKTRKEFSKVKLF